MCPVWTFCLIGNTSTQEYVLTAITGLSVVTWHAIAYIRRDTFSSVQTGWIADSCENPIAIQVLVCVIVQYSQYYKQVCVCLWPISQFGPLYPFLQRHVLGAAHSMFLPQACLHTAEGTNGMQTQITHGQIHSISTQTHICLHLRPEAQEARIYTDSLCTVPILNVCLSL